MPGTHFAHRLSRDTGEASLRHTDSILVSTNAIKALQERVHIPNLSEKPSHRLGQIRSVLGQNDQLHPKSWLFPACPIKTG